MADSKKYAILLKQAIMSALQKTAGQKITEGDLGKQVPDIGKGKHTAINTTQINIAYVRIHEIEFGNQPTWSKSIGVAALSKFLNLNFDDVPDFAKYRWHMAVLAKMFNFQTETQYRLNTPAPVPSSNPFEQYFKKQIKEAERTYNWESCLLLLIDYMHRNTVTKMTICIDDLHFVFKIMPTLIHFIKTKGKQIHFVYAPRHAYALMLSREFLALWKLGIKITVLDFKESLGDRKELGFIFNWVPDDGIYSTQKIRDESVDMIRVKTVSFDRYPFGVLVKSKEDGEIFKSLSIIHEKTREGAPYARPLATNPLSIEPVDKERYKIWFEKRFAESPKSVYYNCKANFETMKLEKLHYRHSLFIRYKVYQSYKILSSEAYESKFESHLFQPVDLFTNGKFGLYPTNPPIIEYNHEKNRWEVAEGHHRLLALSMLGVNVEVPILEITNIKNESAFLENDNTGHLINHDWKHALSLISDIHKEDIKVYEQRNIESITHAIDDPAYIELGNELIAKGLLIKDDILKINEPNHFSLEKYPK